MTMRVTIIRETDTVNVDGRSLHVDCSSLPADFHALQWSGNAGEIEYCLVVCTHCNGRSKKPNETITDLSPYQPLVDAWQAAKVAADEAEAQRLKELQELKDKIAADELAAATPKAPDATGPKG